MEYNPGFALWIAAEKRATVISAGFSWFQPDRAAEYYIPVFFESTNHTELFNQSYTGSALTIDLRYRKYLIGKIGGIYNSIGLSYHHLNLSYASDSDNVAFPEHFTGNRVGFGVGVGYRAFSDNNLNWTIGLFLGRHFYLEKDHHTLAKEPIFETDGGGILRIQLMKFGFAW